MNRILIKKHEMTDTTETVNVYWNYHNDDGSDDGDFRWHYTGIPVVPHKAAAEVSRIGNL